MPGQRSAGQTVIALALREEFLVAIDQARAVSGQNRSEFIRSAIASELARKGERVDRAIVSAPDRAGKGGRPRTTAAYGEQKAQFSGMSEGKVTAKKEKPRRIVAQKTSKAAGVSLKEGKGGVMYTPSSVEAALEKAALDGTDE